MTTILSTCPSSAWAMESYGLPVSAQPQARRANRRLQSILLLLFIGTSLTPALAEAPPALSFFEYLGEMVEHEGEWLDPLTMDAMAPPSNTDVVDSNDATTRQLAPDTQSGSETEADAVAEETR